MVTELKAKHPLVTNVLSATGNFAAIDDYCLSPRLRAYYGSLANLLPSHSNIFFHFLTSSSQVLSFSFYSPNRFSPNFTDSSLNHLSLVCPNYALLFRYTYIHPDRQKHVFRGCFVSCKHHAGLSDWVLEAERLLRVAKSISFILVYF